MSKWKSKTLWVSIAAFVPLVLKGFNIDILPSNYDQIINALLGILVLAGIINSPGETTSNVSEETTVTTTEEK